MWGRVLLAVAILQSIVPQFHTSADENGGTKCAACTVIVALVEQSTQIHNTTVVHELERICNILPSALRPGCKAIVDEVGPTIIKLLEEHETPDVVCNVIGLCFKQTATCRVFPPPPKVAAADYEDHVASVVKRVGRRAPPDICKYLPIVCKIYNDINDHKPVADIDGDLFATAPTLRGTDWRGRDCNDLDAAIHPGRVSADGDKLVDTNCNGIHGVDILGKSYEDMYCKDTQAMGMAILGDSAAAHFHIPPDWLTARELNERTFEHLLPDIENELDWPMLSATTGHFNASRFAPDIHGPMDSLYRRFFELNRCNHRDYQNIGVNGARASDMQKQIIETLARDQAKDKPMFIELALIGNDVCDHQHSIDHMTTPEEFYKAMNGSLHYLEDHAPKGSKVITVGLVDGRILFDAMHARIHPIGSTNNDVTYAALYEYLNCLDVSPCWGWMNNNATVRNLTTDRADSLNAAFKQLVHDVQGKFKNIQVWYMGQIINEGVDAWVKQGGEVWQLIEPVDGFHPNQLANWFTTGFLWKKLEAIPGILPPVNPHNHDIYRTFGDQGGY